MSTRFTINQEIGYDPSDDYGDHLGKRLIQLSDEIDKIQEELKELDRRKF